MILVRDIFNLKFGQAKDAKVLLTEGRELNKKYGFDKGRALTDLTGDSYRLILESEWESLGAWEGAMKKGLSDSDWHKWYMKLIPLVNSASREILNIVD